MPKSFYNEQLVEVDGEKLRLVINFAALDAIEGLLDRSFSDVLTELTQPQGARLGTVGSVLWGLLREHHPTTTLDEAAGLMFGETGATVGLALNKLMEAAFQTGNGKAKDENPPKRRGRSKNSGLNG